MASRSVLPWLVLMLVACSHDRPTAPVATPPTASAPASASASVAPRCTGDATRGRALPSASAIAAADVRAFGGGPVPLADVRRVFASARRLDPCDPELSQWSYSPAGSGSVTVDGARLELSLYLGRRASLAWPDGARVLFDYTEP